MNQAKWLLLVAVGIFVLLPGCKSMDPLVTPDVRVAAVGTEPVGTWDLLSGSGQTGIGHVDMYWYWTGYDPSQTGHGGNDAFENLARRIEYHTNDGYPMSAVHVDVHNTKWTSRGTPGDYNCNGFLVTPPSLPGNEALVSIPVSFLYDLPDGGWDCGQDLYFMIHCSYSGSTDGSAMVGDFTLKGDGANGGGKAWFNQLYLEHLDNPPPPTRDPWPGKSLTKGWWMNPIIGKGPEMKDPNYTMDGYLPTQISPYTDHPTGWVNDATDAAFVFAPGFGDFWQQFLAARLNAYWQKDVTPVNLENAYYDTPEAGEYCENMKVGDIFALALTLDPSKYPDMLVVLRNINEYYEVNQNCLWNSP